MSHPSAALVFGRVELRPAERLLLVDGAPVALGSRGFSLLLVLVDKRDRVVSKDELLDEVWPGLVVEENNLQVQISGLRRVLGSGAIATVQGFGYRFTLAPGAAVQARGSTGHDAIAQPPAPVRGARVLVADDNKVNRLLLCRSLELMGHEVSSAGNGREALELLRRQPFELLLLDLAMPELDGFGLLELRAGDAALREVAVIVTSALGGVAPVARCIELGADDFLHKPVDPWLLKARVESSLARKDRHDRQGAALRRLMPGAPAEASHLPDAVVLVARLHELVRLAATQAPQLTMELLDNWGTLMVDAVEGQRGDIARFAGDDVMALFGEPQAALRAALDMAELTALFNAERAASGRPPVALGVGIARGGVLVGSAFTSRRMAYACIGAPVARAERLSAQCASSGHRVLMDVETRSGLATGTPTTEVPGLAADVVYGTP